MFIPHLFYILLFSVPLVLFPKTSELFEFNKIIVVYIFTALIVSSWIIKAVLEKKITFRRTILDIPLLVFVGSQFLSTLFSIDQRTSLLGYYGRFNGGLLSTICYSLLYWAYVSNMDYKKTLSAIRYTLFAATLVAIYGILQRFGIDKNVWEQDVVNRVFSTLGQPNWLAAFIVALLPLAMSYSIFNKFSDSKFLISIIMSALFFTTLLFTKSRSGLLGFIVADVIFWGVLLLKYKKEFLKEFIIHNSLFLILILIIGTPWTTSIVGKSEGARLPALEAAGDSGQGTESGEIRKIVWKGAYEIWKHYPLFGSGAETFAYSYYNFRPAQHNLVSEWEFLYNKAHNEYLNYLANTGTVGLLAYLILISFSTYQILKNSKIPRFQDSKQIENKNFKFDNFKLLGDLEFLRFGVFAGYISILVSNFFGFSVVAVSLLSFLFPAMAVALSEERKIESEKLNKNLSNSQKALIVLTLFTLTYTLYAISKYWYADVLYSQGKAKNRTGDFVTGSQNLTSAVSFSPNEAIFWDELAYSMSQAAVAFDENSQKAEAVDFAQKATDYSKVATSLSPRNINIKRSQANIFIRLATVNQNYLESAEGALIETTVLAPTDAKIFYNLSLTQVRLGKTEEALKTLTHTIELKPDYRDARFAYALVLIDDKRFNEARNQLNYILQNISSQDAQVTSQLEEIKGR